MLLPPGILQLRPPASGEAAAADTGDRPSDLDISGRYPALRRAQRLGFHLAAFLQEGFDVAEGRQVVFCLRVLLSLPTGVAHCIQVTAAVVLDEHVSVYKVDINEHHQVLNNLIDLIAL